MRTASAPQLGVKEPGLDHRDERTTSVFTDKVGQGQFLGPLRKLKGKENQLEKRDAPTGGVAEQSEDLEEVDLRIFTLAAIVKPKLVDIRHPQNQRPRGHAELHDKIHENSGTTSKKSPGKPSLQQKLRAWHPFRRRSTKDRNFSPFETIPEEEQKETGSSTTSDTVTLSLLRGLEQAFSKQDEEAIMILLELAAGKKLAPLSSSLRRAFSHAVLSHDHDAFMVLLNAASSTSAAATVS